MLLVVWMETIGRLLASSIAVLLYHVQLALQLHT